MKKISLIISITLLFTSFLCIFAGATGGSVIEAQELYAEIPAGYEFSPYYDDDLYFTYMNDDGTQLFIEMQSNEYAPSGITKLTEDQLKQRIIIDFLAEGDEDYAADCATRFSEISVEAINGVKMYKFIGAFAWGAQSLTAEELVYSGMGGYITATQDNIYYFVFMDYDEEFNETAALNEFMSTVSVNGPYFDNDKTTIAKDFASYSSYSQVLSDELYTYWGEDGDFSGDDFYTDEDYEEIGEITYIIGVAVAAIGVIPTLIVLLIAVILILKYIKNKKKLTKLEQQQFTANAYQQPMQYQPYGAQPVAQPVNPRTAYQPVQPVPQPVNTQAVPQPVPQPVNADSFEQTTVLNGEKLDNNQ